MNRCGARVCYARRLLTVGGARSRPTLIFTPLPPLPPLPVSWDRMPFLTEILTPGTPSYTPAMSETSRMFIIANYGAAQGYDNDDDECLSVLHCPHLVPPRFPSNPLSLLSGPPPLRTL